MEVKFVIARLKENGHGVRGYCYAGGFTIWSFISNVHEADHFDSYDQAEEALRNQKPSGIYQIEKIFIIA